ncbi:drug/metabolite transporter, DME family [Pollutimonas bauzanensis]|uniref:Drug/metabolite transporter, DME family n=2 Tax=Pollutimonas bauzanensis TaxID=658167 RepID=A0A1M5ZBI8_9BURK|nr:drug/metabolite transporter, DME family [Pollutimonas bauzanensis]
MALGAAVLWGTTGTAQSFAPPQTSPYWIGALRLAIACLFFGAYAARGWRGGGARVAAGGRRMAGGILLAGLCMAAYNLTFFAGVKATGVAVGTALAIGSGPVWAGVLQFALTGRAPQGVWWLGTALAVAGAGLMVAVAGGGLRLDAGGITLCLLAGLAYAGYTLISQRLVRRAPPAIVTLWVFGVAAAISAPAAFIVAGPFSSTAAGWTVVTYLGVVSTGVAFLLFSHALQYISGPSGVTLALAEPVTAFALAVFVVGERPPATAFAGLGMVLAGLAAVVWTEARGRRGGKAA